MGLKQILGELRAQLVSASPRKSLGEVSTFHPWFSSGQSWHQVLQHGQENTHQWSWRIQTTVAKNEENCLGNQAKSQDLNPGTEFKIAQKSTQINHW